MYTRPDMTNPTDRLAYYLSELHNPRAPLGWEQYRFMANCLLDKFDMREAVMKANL